MIILNINYNDTFDNLGIVFKSYVLLFRGLWYEF